MNDDLVTVARLNTLGAAQAARARLEADGIRAIVHENDALRIDPFRTHGVEIRVQVRAEDAEVARELLEAIEES